MRLRKVATIPIRTAADLAQTPYTDRTIERDNTWRWRRGRMVYELVAPGGDVYVMQSYSQILDPKLSLGKLRRARRAARASAGLALPRAPPPPRSRGRRQGRQGHDRPGRAPEHLPAGEDHAPARAAQAAPGERRRATTKNVPADTPGTLEDDGHRHGHAVRPRVGAARGHARERPLRRAPSGCSSPRGSVSGTATMPFTIEGSEIHFRGTATLHRRAPAPTAASRAATLEAQRRQHAGRPERRDLARGLRDLLGGAAAPA